MKYPPWSKAHGVGHQLAASRRKPALCWGRKECRRRQPQDSPGNGPRTPSSAEGRGSQRLTEARSRRAVHGRADAARAGWFGSDRRGRSSGLQWPVVSKPTVAKARHQIEMEEFGTIVVRMEVARACGRSEQRAKGGFQGAGSRRNLRRRGVMRSPAGKKEELAPTRPRPRRWLQ